MYERAVRRAKETNDQTNNIGRADLFTIRRLFSLLIHPNELMPLFVYIVNVNKVVKLGLISRSRLAAEIKTLFSFLVLHKYCSCVRVGHYLCVKGDSAEGCEMRL